MKVLAINSSARKGKTTDTLIDQAIEGLLSKNPDAEVKKIYLMDKNIEYCRNCLTCRDSKEKGPRAKCIIRDDMDEIGQDLLDCDAVIFGTPIHMGFATAPMMTFAERVCWTFAKPEGRELTVTGCPIPRSTEKKRKTVIIATNAIIPPIFRRFCDQATALLKDMSQCGLNAKVVGDLYAGAIEKRGLDVYMDKARALGARLA
jgi:multimeric flavodoxin WrbA